MSETFFDGSPVKKRRRGRPPTKAKADVAMIGESTLTFSINSSMNAYSNSAATIRQGAVCSTPVMKISPSRRRVGGSQSQTPTPTPRRRQPAPALKPIQENKVAKAHHELVSVTQPQNGLDSSPASSSRSSPSDRNPQSSQAHTSPLNAAESVPKPDLNPSLLQPTDIFAPKTPKMPSTPLARVPPSTPVSHFSHVLSSSPMYTHWYAQTPHGRVASTPNSLVPKPLRFEDVRQPATPHNQGLGILAARHRSLPAKHDLEKITQQLQSKLRKTQSLGDAAQGKGQNDLSADYQVTVQINSDGKATVVTKRRKLVQPLTPATYGPHFTDGLMYGVDPPPGLKIGIDPYVVGVSSTEFEMKSPYMLAEGAQDAAKTQSDARFALRELLDDL
ncbi:hypothetical protein KL930_004596 [Ogataea haglerorum]|uniref:Uncharacterized protein n=1 Tax=Ogataea haglerorum TaxID=1937702 RepID=A0AAN6D2F5_9ASCO|nr:uncharacterized protein KL911_000426 [Ogataea haglerorum]KAG7700845.1 hypothetical protein KL951_000960 [Ogataea haglerorum]KAG7724964.1 hypothetical protein KL933_004397 [Ogataea haglerorum]KAG7733698.1 hypothetical protein KL948_000900 [Ogataea haglerorum]KAG7746208.1 hypothetical protein KL912_004468 [Ogataea haglerorum]KAG7759289.1 hypothetical protein KL911_000426 [Ogataea haglerorum]